MHNTHIACSLILSLFVVIPLAAEEVGSDIAIPVTGKAYLAYNATQEGVTTLKSGLQYKVLKSGKGATPRRRDNVLTHYRGWFIDGKEFDSSFKRNKPAEFPVSGVIPGWTEALLKMKEGDKWRLVIPYKLAYGRKGYGPIPAKSTLVFEMELLEVKKR